MRRVWYGYGYAWQRAGSHTTRMNNRFTAKTLDRQFCSFSYNNQNVRQLPNPIVQSARNESADFHELYSGIPITVPYCLYSVSATVRIILDIDRRII